MRAEHLQEILSSSIESGKGGREKNLKVYLRFYSKSQSVFEENKRKRIEKGNENEYQSQTEDYIFYFDEWDWGVVIYHSLDENGTKKIEQFLNGYTLLRVPWVKKVEFEKLARDFIKDGGRVSIERAFFEPYDDYSGYGLTVQIRGKKTNEVMAELNEKYAIHPRKVGIEIGNEDQIKFEFTNVGRISFSSGSVDSMILIIGKYVDLLRKYDKSYEFKQSYKTIENEISYRNVGEIICLKLPSIAKTRGTLEDRNKAIVDLLTSGEGEFGYIGIPLGQDRVNMLDLKERKALQITITNNEMYIYSENPSEARSAIRTLVSEIASHIDPDIEVCKIIPGDAIGQNR